GGAASLALLAGGAYALRRRLAKRAGRPTAAGAPADAGRTPDGDAPRTAGAAGTPETPESVVPESVVPDSAAHDSAAPGAPEGRAAVVPDSGAHGVRDGGAAGADAP
ncbi:hypothetical protein ACFXGE_24730, partial [Streptomyces sp. NPDC059378]